MSPGPGAQVESGVGQAASLGVGSPHLQCCFDLLWNGSFLRVIFLRLCFGESLVTPVWLFLEPSAGGTGSVGSFPPELQAKICAHLFACNAGQLPER